MRPAVTSRRGHRPAPSGVVSAMRVKNLRELEQEEAQKRETPEYKFGTNEEMLEKIMSVG